MVEQKQSRDLSLCETFVSTLMSDTQQNGLTGTGTRPGVGLWKKPTDLSEYVTEDRENDGGVVVKLNHVGCGMCYGGGPPSLTVRRLRKLNPLTN